MVALHHLAFRTQEVARLSAFYEHWLGLARVRESERSVWLALDGGVLMIERAEPHEPAPPAGSLELFAVRFGVHERAGLRARLAEAGMLEAETAHTVYFRDPDGRRVAASSHPLTAT
jgi:catechol 2,3-dioxygenase-like lactoylglutathione lyase family enzyme